MPAPYTNVLFSDTFVDANGVLLMNHAPVGSPTPFAWEDLLFTLGALDRGLEFIGNGLLNDTLSFGQRRHVMTVDIGADDYEATIFLDLKSLANISSFSGLVARWDRVELDGYFFGVRSDNLPQIRLFNLAGTFVEQAYAIPAELVGTTVKLTVRVQAGVITGYLNDAEVVSIADAAYAAGGTVAISGGWPQADPGGQMAFRGLFDVSGLAVNVGPVAEFSSTNVGRTATFTDESSDEDGDVVGWLWDFGDGETSTQQNPVHTYATAGTYTVTLTVTDDGDLTDEIEHDITVTCFPEQCSDVADPAVAVGFACPADPAVMVLDDSCIPQAVEE